MYDEGHDCKVHAHPIKVFKSIATTVDKYNQLLRLHEKVAVNTRFGLKTGRVRYIGKVYLEPEHYVGLELEGPYGKNDGSANGIRY